MRPRTVIILLVLAAVVGAAGTAVYLSRNIWLAWLPGAPEKPDKVKEDGHGAHGDWVELSAQAKASLRLRTQPVKVDTYWRTLHIPGSIVERRGISDRSVSTPIAGIVRQVLALKGDTVSPGASLVVLQPISESLQTSQTELLKAVQEKKIAQEKYNRLAGTAGAAVPESQLLDAKAQVDRQEAIQRAQRADLLSRGLTPGQIDEVEKGNFLREITIHAPADAGTPTTTPARPQAVFEVEEVKVQRGDQVQAGDALAILANHENLAIEGHGFRGDAPLLEKAAQNGWEVTVEVTGETGGQWKKIDRKFTIDFLANTLDADNQTFPFYLSLPNRFTEYRREGKTFRVWEYRPGQRVRLGVRVDRFDNVFILPSEAVVREGGESYVFRQNGDVFERKPVHVLFEDTLRVVIANDGSIIEGNHIAQNSAATLNRALKAKEEGGGGSDHGHAH